MNWQALGSIADAVGAVAIVVSLVYVAIQIRQNTRQIALTVQAEQLAAFERSVESGNRIRELLIVNPELAQLFMAGSRDYRQLEPTAKLRFNMLVRNIFSAIQGAYMRQTSVGHDPLGFESQEKLIDTMLALPGVRQCMADLDPDWHPDFRSLVTQRLARVTDED